VSAPGIIASNFRWIQKNTLQASVDLEIPAWFIKYKRCLWHRKGDKEWVAFSSAEWTDRSGAKRYVDIIEITDNKVRDRFQAAALAIIHAIANRSGGRPGASPDQPKGDK
jgi:hypothetical protein